MDKQDTFGYMPLECNWQDWIGQAVYVCDPFDHIMRERGVAAVRYICQRFLEMFCSVDDEWDGCNSVRVLCRLFLDELDYEEDPEGYARRWLEMIEKTQPGTTEVQPPDPEP